MERRDFFRKFGIGVAVVVAAPMMVAKAMETKPMKPIMTRYADKKINTSFYKTIRVDHKGWYVPTKEGWTQIWGDRYSEPLFYRNDYFSTLLNKQ